MEALAHPGMPALALAVFGPLDWGVVALYFAVMIYIGVVAARKDQDTREYFLAHRSIPTWAVAISIVATSLSAATFVGVPDAAFGGNLSYLVSNVGGLIAVVIVATLFVPKLYRAGTVTIYGFLNERYGQGAMIAVSIMFLLGRMLASGARLFIAAIPLGLLIFARRNDTHFHVSHGQLMIAIILIGGLGTFYTAFGGIRTVIWIDVIQFFIVVGAAGLTICLLFHAIPLSPSQLYKALATPGTAPSGHSKLFVSDLHLDLNNPFTLWSAIFGSSFLSVAAFGVDQDLAQRFLVAKSVTRGALSLIWAQLISVVVVSMFLLIGLLLYVFYRRPDLMGGPTPINPPNNGQGSYAWFLLNQLPTVLSGIAIVGFFAIAQGSMDSAINALASSAVADIYYPLLRKFRSAGDAARASATPKLAVAIMGICMTGLGIVSIFLYDPHDHTLIDFALGILAFPFAGMLGVFLTALLTRRGNTVHVILALCAGVYAVVLMQPHILQWWIDPLFAQFVDWSRQPWMSKAIASMLDTAFNRQVHLASTWWMPIGTTITFLICVSGRPGPGPKHVAAEI